MFDYYVKADDATHLQAVLVEAGVATVQEDQLVPVEGVNLDVIGTWSERTGGTDEEPEYTAVEGYHANIRSSEELVFPAGFYTGLPSAPWRGFGNAPQSVVSAAGSTNPVDIERDRRIDAGFIFEGKKYQSRATDRENIAGAALFALLDASYETQWIASDNTLVLMDSVTLLAFAKAAAEHKQKLIFNARTIKDMVPVPEDFRNDNYWTV